jgi:hypothetical protein
MPRYIIMFCELHVHSCRPFSTFKRVMRGYSDPYPGPDLRTLICTLTRTLTPAHNTLTLTLTLITVAREKNPDGKTLALLPHSLQKFAGIAMLFPDNTD